MDDPAGELRRQRALIAAHLQWLDQQIARSAGAATSAPPTGKPAEVPPLPTIQPVDGAVASPAPAELPGITMPEIDPGSVRNEVRRGCFIYVIIVTVLLAASIAVAVWIGGQ